MSEPTKPTGTPAPADTPAAPPATPAPTGPSTEDVAALRADLARQQDELERGREELNFLTQTFSEILAGQRNGTPAVEPAAPTVDDFNADPTGATARVAEAAAKRAVESLAGRVAPLIDNIAERTWAMELAQVQQHDPKNYGRLAKQVTAYFKQYPNEKKRAGAAWDVFYRLRGQYHDEIRNLDEAERKTTTVASPASPATAPAASEKPKRPELTQKEHLMIRGLGISEAAYLKQRYGWEEAPANG